MSIEFMPSAENAQSTIVDANGTIFNYSHSIPVVNDEAPVLTANLVNMYCQLQGAKALKIEQFREGEPLDTPRGIYLSPDFAPHSLMGIIEKLQDSAPQHFKTEGEVDLISPIMCQHYVRLAMDELGI